MKITIIKFSFTKPKCQYRKPFKKSVTTATSTLTYLLLLLSLGEAALRVARDLKAGLLRVVCEGEGPSRSSILLLLSLSLLSSLLLSLGRSPPLILLLAVGGGERGRLSLWLEERWLLVAAVLVSLELQARELLWWYSELRSPVLALLAGSPSWVFSREPVNLRSGSFRLSRSPLLLSSPLLMVAPRLSRAGLLTALALLTYLRCQPNFSS